MLHDHPAGDVVDDDRPVARPRDRLEVGHDPALRRLVVVRRDHEEPVGADLVRRLGHANRVARVVRAGAREDGGPVADRVDPGPDQVDPLVVVERRALARRPGDDDPVGAVVDEILRDALERIEVDRAVLAETASRSR